MTKLKRASLLFGEFQRYEFCWLLAGVGERVRVSAGEPLRVARLELTGHGTLALNVTAKIEVADGDQEMRAFMVMGWDCATGL